MLIPPGRPGSGVLVSLTPELTLHPQRVPDKCAFLVESLSISSDQVPGIRSRGRDRRRRRGSICLRKLIKIEIYTILITQIIRTHQRKSVFKGELTLLLRRML